MFYSDRIMLKGELGKRYFVFPNGEKTKTFYNADKFIFSYGQYPILNENGDVVEYMDLMGNFSEGQTELARRLYDYALSINQIPYKALGVQGQAYTGVLDFPSKFLKNEKVREFIEREEKKRFHRLCRGNGIPSFLHRIRYKLYIDKVWKQKMKKVQRLLQEDAEQQNDLEI